MLMSLASTANGVELIGSVIYELGEISFINPHCLMSNSNPSPVYFFFYIPGDDATGIGIERFTA